MSLHFFLSYIESDNNLSVSDVFCVTWRYNIQALFCGCQYKMET